MGRGARPLFLYLPFQAVHSPLEAPKDAVAQYKNLSNPHRAVAAAMTTVLDSAVETLVGVFKQEGLWNNTLLVFSADNVRLRPDASPISSLAQPP